MAAFDGSVQLKKHLFAVLSWITPCHDAVVHGWIQRLPQSGLLPHHFYAFNPDGAVVKTNKCWVCLST